MTIIEDKAENGKMAASRVSGGTYQYGTGATTATATNASVLGARGEKPPLMPKYQGYTSGSAGASYRLASMDRLANRQRVFDTTTPGSVGQNGTASSPTTPSGVCDDKVTSVSVLCGGR